VMSGSRSSSKAMPGSDPETNSFDPSKRRLHWLSVV
jgi:hypothetical protein